MAKQKLNKEMIERARRLASELRTDKEIYTALGISESYFYEIKNGTSGGELSPLFVEALKKGHDEYLQNLEQEALANIRAAKEWQSDAWLLERCLPERYGRVDRLQATLEGNMSNEIVINIGGGEDA